MVLYLREDTRRESKKRPNNNENNTDTDTPFQDPFVGILNALWRIRSLFLNTWSYANQNKESFKKLKRT